MQKFPKQLNKYLDTFLKDYRIKTSGHISDEIKEDPSEKIEKAGDYLINSSEVNFGRAGSTNDVRLE